MTAQPQLFDQSQAPRRKRVVRTVVIDAGHVDGAKDHLVRYECRRCGLDAGWYTVRTVSEGKRGAPCPRCNDEKEDPMTSNKPMRG